MYVHEYTHIQICMYMHTYIKGERARKRRTIPVWVATISRLLNITGLFCKRAL